MFVLGNITSWVSPNFHLIKIYANANYKSRRVTYNPAEEVEESPANFRSFWVLSLFYASKCLMCFFHNKEKIKEMVNQPDIEIW